MLTAFALLAGFAGRFHGAGDTFALARPLFVPILALLSLIAFAVRPRLLGAIGLALAVSAAVSLVPPTPVASVADDARRYTVYQKNLLWGLQDVAPVFEDIESSDADFVMLQEVHPRNRPLLERLRGTYPHQHFCPVATKAGGIAVLSRVPPTEVGPVCEQYSRMAALQIATPDGPLWVVSLHLYWPFPFAQPRQLERMLPMLEALDGPVVLGGDFNIVSWTYAANAVERATQTTNAGYAGGTFEFQYDRWGRNLLHLMPKIPIDHILVPETGAALTLTRRPLLGSDHHGLVATFAMAPR
ncbi:MAG: endonuclease/exonuclease/phosphatase family protein [Pseudomonadota bacterium]